jgi:DNA-binding NarL/FixJ family response regulator
MLINVAIVDDHPLAISGLLTMLKDIPDIHITATYDKSTDLLEGLKSNRPDVLLLDIKMPEYDGEDLATIISRSYPEIKMIAITSYDAPAYIKMMMKAGCKGYLLKNTRTDNLVHAIQEVHAGRDYIEPSLQQQFIRNLYAFKKAEKKAPTLTQRELEVLELIVAEYTNQDIAEKLFISVRTVDKHRISLLHKLGAKNTAGIVKNAIELGLIKGV